MSSIVEMASNRIAEMLEKSKETQTGVKLEVNENILESCTSKFEERLLYNRVSVGRANYRNSKMSKNGRN